VSTTIFVTCLADTFYPDAVRALTGVLERLGWSWSCPKGQTCCGQPMFNAGHFDPARTAARHFITVFEKTDGPIVCPSASCTAMVRHQYPRLFENDPDWRARAKRIADRTFEFSEYLVNVAKVDLRPLKLHFSESVTYHYSCHLRPLGITDEPIRLIEQIDRIDYRPLDGLEQCCGFGGTFSINYPHISEALVDEKVHRIRATQADWLVFSDAGCAMNITGYAHRIGKPIRAMHLVQLLARAMGVAV